MRITLNDLLTFLPHKRVMSFEGHPKNSFRALIDAGAAPLLATKPKTKRNPDSDGLGSVAVPRAETRRGNHRDRDRHRLTGEQAVVRFKRKLHQVELVNVSQGGAMIEGKFSAKLWDRMELRLGGNATIDCRVCWVNGNRFGLEFSCTTRVEGDSAAVDAMLSEIVRKSFPEFDGNLEGDSGAGASQSEGEAADLRQPRTSVRHSLVWHGTLHHGFEWQEVLLRNISTNGALIECEAELPEGANVSLDLASAGRLSGTVCWSHGPQTGITFVEPFDIQKLSGTRPGFTPWNG